MAQSDLVKEIEEAEKIAREQVDEYSKRILGFADGDNESRCNEWRYVQATLQRARDALRWKPFPKQVPEGGNGDYLVQRAIPSGGAIRTKIQTSTYWANSARRQGAPGSWGCSGVVAFMELPPKYTPEETER